MKRKFVCLLAALALSLSAFTGCGERRGGEIIIGGDDNSGGTLRIGVYEAGYGVQWIKDIAKAFSAAYNVQVRFSVSSVAGELIQLAASDECKMDIIMPVGQIDSLQDAGKLVELTDVYNAVPDGETVKIKDKMNQNVRRKLEKDGKFYQMNWANSISTICYNKTMLDKYLPGAWAVPRTTDELVELADKVKTTGQAAFSLSLAIDYWDYMSLAWWAQYSGREAYYNYYACKYWDGGEWKLADNAQIFDDPGRLKAVGVTSRLISQSNGYVHSDAASMSFTDAQVAFAGNGFGDNQTECAMIVSGDWMENELQKYLTQNPQDIRMMKVPVISSITETLEDASMTDDTLASIVQAIDEGKTYEQTKAVAPALGENDFNRIAEARDMVYSATFDHPIGVLKTGANTDNAIKFLKFMCSDVAQKIYANDLNGLSMVYGYQRDPAEVSSEFVKSRLSLFGNEYDPICVDKASPYVYRGGLNAFKSGSRDAKLYRGTSAKSLLDETKTYYASIWSTVLAAVQ